MNGVRAIGVNAVLGLVLLLPAAVTAEDWPFGSFSDEETFVWQPAPTAPPDPAAPATTPEGPRTSSRSSRTSARSTYARLSRAPNMFGDSFGTAGQLIESPFVMVPREQIPPQNPPGVPPQNPFQPFPIGTGDATDLPCLGGGVIKIGENNKPMPMDRVFLQYNAFFNALSVGQPVATDLNAFRYTVGFESSFHEGNSSIAVAMPFNEELQFDTTAYTVEMGTVGNLTLYYKRLLYADDSFAIATGLGAGLPTGSDLEVVTHQTNPFTGQINTANLRVRNEAVHLVPFIGFLSTPHDESFSQLFLSLDLATRGNPVDVGNPATTAGILTPQNLFHVDFSLGRWLHQNPHAARLNGIAALAEVHYTKTIQDSDDIVVLTNPGTGPLVNARFTNLANRVDIVNVTGGLQFQLGDFSNLRVGYVVPVTDRPDRAFDSEVQVQFNRNF